MYNNKRILALIPARSGSKGLPHKNLKLLMGKPLIAWTIEQAKGTRYIDRVIVSTEDEETGRIARDFGGEVPFIRPKDLASDGTPGIDVALHALAWLENNENAIYDILVFLQPTSPLRDSNDIEKAVEKLFLKNAEAIVSVCKAEHHPYWMNMLPDDDCMRDFERKGAHDNNMGRQDLPVFYRVNGALYVAYCNYLKMHKNFLGKKTFAYKMPQNKSVDIDTILDFDLAEMIVKNKMGS